MPTLAYCATLNNYTPDEVATLKNPKDFIQYFIAGHEVGEKGTPHLQIYFQLTKQIRMTTIKKWGRPWDRMHFEASRGSDEDNYAYCSKEGSFWEYGERKPMPGKGARMDLIELKKAIDEGMSYDDICDTHFEASLRYYKFIKERVQARLRKTELASLLEEYEDVSWKPWQLDLLDTLAVTPSDREILWYYDQKGNSGKSFLTTYLMASGRATLVGAGKKADMAYLLTKGMADIVIFDLPRTAEEHMDGMYQLAEELKNRRLISTKYDSETLVFSKKHVVIFANFKPNTAKWSEDRCVQTSL